MKIEELETAVELQKKAYGLLLWLKQRAKTNPQLLSAEQAEPFASGERCAEWVLRRLDAFPHEFRPERQKIRAFGFVFSSFFSTSFRIGQTRDWDAVETTLVLGATPFRGRRHKRHAEQRQQEVADELRRLALASLAEERGLNVSADVLEQALASPETSQDLTLWTYGCELVRRAQFASQGTGVHRLWLELGEKVRKNLSSETLWKARDRLVQWLNSR